MQHFTTLGGEGDLMKEARRYSDKVKNLPSISDEERAALFAERRKHYMDQQNKRKTFGVASVVTLTPQRRRSDRRPDDG